MTQISNATAAGASAPSSQPNALNDIDLNVFLELMIAELQNQDPLNPLENDELLAQISQIREVGATDRLTQTLEAVLIGQNIASATNLIGADVTALSDAGERVSGNVRRVTIDNGQPTLDLAVDVQATAPAAEGGVQNGRYVYNVVWEGDDGELYGVEVEANTANFAGFVGAVQLDNLPETAADKRIYRTDRTGQGDLKLIGTLRGGAASLIDTVPDAQRQAEVLEADPQIVSYARKVSVALKNVAEINPPQ